MERETMMRRLPASIVALLILPAVLMAQSKPNFTGKWAALDAATAQGMGGPGGALTVAQDDKTFKVTSTTQMGEILTTYLLDGSKGKSNLDFNGNSIDRTTTLKCDGDKLLLTTVADFQGNQFETKQVWTIDPSGNLVIESTRPDFQGGGAPVTSKATFKKQS
jgi:surface antigen